MTRPLLPDAPPPRSAAVPREVDALICGAGPVGLLMANLLGQQGLRTLVVEKRTNASTIPRAIGLCEEGSRALLAAGLHDAVAAHTHRTREVDFVDARGRSLIQFDLDGTLHGLPRLRMFFQPELEATLRQGLERFSNVELVSGCALTRFEDRGDAVVCTLDRGGRLPAVRARFLLGCDGANSAVREALGVAMRGATYAEPWLIVDADCDPDPGPRAVFLCDPARPGVTMSASGKRRRWEFLMRPGESEAEVLRDEFLAPLLAPWGSLESLRIARRTVYAFEARVAERLRVGRVFLLGDAAHLTPPFLGQGLMAGFRDTLNLAWKLGAHVRGEAGDTLLESYHDERRPHARQVVVLAKLLGTFILPRGRVTGWLRDRVAGVVTRLAGRHKVRIRKTPNHIRGASLATALRIRPDRVGFEVPDHPLCDLAGRPRRLDELLYGRFALVSCGRRADAFRDPALRARWAALGGRRVTILRGAADAPPPADDEIQLVDEAGRYAELLRGGERVALLRPDWMIVANVPRARLEATTARHLAWIGGGIGTRPTRAAFETLRDAGGLTQ